MTEIWSDFYAAFKPYWPIVVLLLLLCLADRLFHKTIKELMAGIIEEIKGILNVKRISLNSINLLGGIVVFLLILIGVAGKEVAHVMRLYSQHGLEGREQNTVLFFSAFLIGLYFIISVALCGFARKR
jgi:hypothetical protein